MMGSVARLAKPVTLNLFQGPLCLTALSERAEEWMLKRVQHDDEGRGRA